MSPAPLGYIYYSAPTRDILTSFTSTADDSPSVRLAQQREGRRATRQARTGSIASMGAAGGTVSSSPESFGDEVWHDASLGLPHLRLNHDAASQISGSPKYQTEAGSPASTRGVALPAIDDGPPQDDGEPSSAIAAATSSSAPATAPHRSFSPIAIAEIPPYRGARPSSPSATPAAGSPAPASEQGDSPSSAGTSAAQVKIVDGGVIAKLKAARMAKQKAAGAGSPTASPSSSTPLADAPSPSVFPPAIPSHPASRPTTDLPFDLPTPPNATPRQGGSTASSSPAFTGFPPTPDLASVSPRLSAASRPAAPSSSGGKGVSPLVQEAHVGTAPPSSNPSTEQVLADMRARNAAREQNRRSSTTNDESGPPGRLSFSPSPSVIAPPASSFAPPPPRPSSNCSSSSTSSRSSHRSPRQKTPVDAQSPGLEPATTAPHVEAVHDSTVESRAAEVEAWFKGERKGGEIVDVEDWKHHSLSEVDEQTERSSISTRPPTSSHGGARAAHTRNSSLSSLPSLPPASAREGRPLSTFSVSSSTGRQLADGSYKVAGATLPTSSSKRRPTPNIIETAARMLEGYQGSSAQQDFDAGTAELRRYVEREREILGISFKAARVDSSSEGGSSRQQQRSASPTRRPLSPELARKAAVFGGDTNVARGEAVFAKGADDQAETVSQQEKRQRKEREVDKVNRRREREERGAARRVEDGAVGSRSGSQSQADSSYGSLPPRRSDMAATGATAEETLPPPPVLWEGVLSTPPPSLSISQAIADPSSWISRYAVLTADTLEFRPTDSTGPFIPIVSLISSEIRYVEDGLKASQGFKPFTVITRDGNKHLFATSKAIDKVNWIVAFDNVVSRSRQSRSVSSLLGDGAPRSTSSPSRSPSKRAIGTDASPRRSQESAAPPLKSGVDAKKSTTGSVRRAVSFKSTATEPEDSRRREMTERLAREVKSPRATAEVASIDVDRAHGSPPRSGPSRSGASSAPRVSVQASADVHGALAQVHEQPPAQRDLFGILRDRPLPPSPSVNDEQRFTSHQPLPSSSVYTSQSRRPVFSSGPSPYTHQRSRSELPTPPLPSALPQDAPPLRPTPLRSHSQPTSFTVSTNSDDSHPSRLSYADLLAPGPARELRDALTGMIEATMQMGRDTDEQADALRKLKDITAIIIGELDAQADLGRAEAVELRWELRDKLFDTYDALKQAQSRAPSRAPSQAAHLGDPNRPCSRTSSDSAYEEEDLARINLLTRNVLSMLNAAAGDGSSERIEASSYFPTLTSRPPPHFEQSIPDIQSPLRQSRARPQTRAEPSPQAGPRRANPIHRQPQHPTTQPQFDDAASQTTRGAGHSPSEHASWEDDRFRYEQEARIATAAHSPLDSSVASPHRTLRERTLAADMLEGRAPRAVPPSSIDLATFQDSLDPPHPRRGEPHSRSLYTQAEPLPSKDRGQPSRAPPRRREDPYVQSVTEPRREMSHWSRTTSTDGVEPADDDGSHVCTSYSCYTTPLVPTSHAAIAFGHEQPVHVHTSRSRLPSDRGRYGPPHLHRNAASEDYTATSASDRALGNIDVLRGLQEQFRITGDHISTANHQRDQMGLFVNQLAEIMHESRHSNDTQFERLISTVEDLRTHLGELPDLLARRLRTELVSDDPFAPQPATHHHRSTSAPPFAEQDQQQTVQDEDHGSVSTLVDQLEAQAEAQLDGDPTARAAPHKVKFGVNPLSSFAQLDQKMAESSDVYDDKGKLVRRGSASGVRKPRGPRMPGMPGLKMWGGPAQVSTAEHAARWGGGARSLSRAQDKDALDHALKDDALSRKPKNGPIVEAIKTDEGLAQALQNLAEGTGEKEVDAGTMAIAVFEILQSMREISRKQKEQEAREKAEKAKNGGLSRRERAELEAKKEEIKRLEAIAGIGGSREAKLDQALSALQAKSTEQDTLLHKITAAMETSKTTLPAEMDPALKEETKKLLGQVKSGFDDHVKDFRGQLTNEVQRMFKEVGKLRDEKKSLQTDIAELMSFQAKHGGSSSGGSAKGLLESKPPASSSPLKPGMPTSGFFGPRSMK